MTKTTTRPTLTGTVVKKSGIQTVRVEVKHTKVHPVYKKRYTQTTSYLVHDPSDKVEVGQTVTITVTKPVSKRKRWQIA